MPHRSCISLPPRFAAARAPLLDPAGIAPPLLQYHFIGLDWLGFPLPLPSLSPRFPLNRGLSPSLSSRPRPRLPGKTKPADSEEEEERREPWLRSCSTARSTPPSSRPSRSPTRTAPAAAPPSSSASLWRGLRTPSVSAKAPPRYMPPLIWRKPAWGAPG
uniref:PLD1 n=1 Tax=Arundo donax TaxID=35708 RepID=A0A0A9DIB7_ARUDO